METTTLIIPGFRGSGPDHWQTWMEPLVSGARRVEQIDWDAPMLMTWADAVAVAIRGSSRPVWLVAHSFGCLAAITAAAGLSSRIAGALLVAPADPERFSLLGSKEAGRDDDLPSIAAHLPREALSFPSLVVASANDPWMSSAKVAEWARCWESVVVDIGRAGHINTESGFGPWPEGLDLLRMLQSTWLPGSTASADRIRQRPRRVAARDRIPTAQPYPANKR
ncbi:RBBP9/YdeN family alpha/beta hydrolase [Thiocapsa rosea]|uniref:Alpha/beta hydrolase n=1 Tax=Thiocapsa rosea TaxID=69360 RepID=A0A495VFG6_9GAMM|nr:alpha/beta fold hydrolase [Thiocapsa rosea]RKT47167.1 hypothetical protein BDD21_4726 [Thiocapsa rosea]